MPLATAAERIWAAYGMREDAASKRASAALPET